MASHIDTVNNPVQIDMGKGYILTIRMMVGQIDEKGDADLIRAETMAGNGELFDDNESE